MTHYTPEELREQRRIQRKLNPNVKGISEEEFQRRLEAILGFVRGPNGDWIKAPIDNSVSEVVAKNQLIHPRKGEDPAFQKRVALYKKGLPYHVPKYD